MCDNHKMMKQQQAMNRIRSGRNVMHSDFIDLNFKHKQVMLEEQERRIGAFNSNGMRTFKNNVPKHNKPALSPRSQKKL